MAKPIIDLLVIVRDVEAIDAHNARLEAHGYEPRGENGIRGRRYFVKWTHETRTHHVHMFAVGSTEIQRHLDFWDYVRCHPAQARAYGDLKEALAARYPEDARAYGAGKGDLIREIEAKARRWREARSEDGGA